MSGAERWVPVEGWHGYYEVSDLGRVRSLARVISHPHTGTMTIRERVLRSSLDSKGYPQVDLRRNGERFAVKVHRLVAKAFVPGEQPGLEVCHADSNPGNPAASNLRWDTHASNMRQTVEDGTNPHSAKTECPKGHPYSAANTSIRNGGRERVCRTCHNETARRSRERKAVMA
ncbi:NUMOD4 domain-containing protein [Agromyces sp. NPDC058064]|uniref:NUMOD4 domain-containing protein n=1 Tax=Agromyces sp. NPDC058064 TaxID=3346322 RepID=UPI0036D9F012